MHLIKPYKVIEQRYLRLGDIFESDIIQKQHPLGLDRYRRWYLLEGLLSSAWQSWCGFCRTVVHQSCNQAITVNGNQTSVVPNGHSPGRVGYIAKKIRRPNSIKPTGEVLTHQEPTWGDPDLLIDTITYLAPSNQTELLSGLNLQTNAPDHMRKVRNAAAHLSTSGFADVEALKIYYTGNRFQHPLDLMFWDSIADGESAFSVWLADILEMADLMIQ